MANQTNNTQDVNSSKIDAGAIVQAGIGGAGALSTAYSIYGNVKSKEDLMGRINSMYDAPYRGTDSFDSLTQSYLNYSPYRNFTMDEIGFNKGAAGMNVASASMQGAGAGATFGPWGALVGGLAGLGAGLFGFGAAQRKAKKTLNFANSKISEVNKYNLSGLDNRLSNAQREQLGNLRLNSGYALRGAYGGPLGVIEGPIDYSMAMQYLDMKNNAIQNKLMADGGQLHSHGSDWNTGLNYVGNGGSHEENPYDGVPMGIAPDGQPNLVEEGEVIWNNDYVFSKRLKVPKAVRNKYKLRGTKPMSFAEAVMQVNKEAEERPNDPITLRGRDTILGALAEAQEVQRAKKEAKEQSDTPILQGIQPMVAANGGAIHIDKNKRGTFTAAASRHGKSVQEFASQVLANPENYSPAMRKKANFARNAAKWHSKGGHLFPLGGEYLDWLKGLTPDDYNTVVNNIGGKALNYRNNPEGLFKFANYKKPGPVYEGLQNAYMYSNPPGLNGPLNPEIERGIDIPNIVSFNIPTNRLSRLEDIGEGMYSVPNSNGEVTFNLLNTNNEDINDKQKTPSSNTDWVSRLRYIPAIGAGIGVLSDLFGWTNKPDYSQADAIARAARGMGTISASPIGDYLTYRPMDRMFALNMLNANAGGNRRAILDTTGGNRGTAMAGLLASDNNTLNNIGNLFRQAEEYNAQQRERVAAFNRSTNMFNSELDLNAQKANLGRDEVVMRGLQAAAAMRDAIDQRVGAAKSANLTNFLQSVGDIGWEAFNRNMINSNRAMYYTIDSDGNIKYKDAFYSLPREMQDVLRERAEIDKKVKSLGGILSKRRR